MIDMNALFLACNAAPSSRTHDSAPPYVAIFPRYQLQERQFEEKREKKKEKGKGEKESDIHLISVWDSFLGHSYPRVGQIGEYCFRLPADP